MNWVSIVGDEKHIACGRLPNRKQPALFVEDGSVIRVLAYFRDEAAMEEFLSFRLSFIPQIGRLSAALSARSQRGEA